MKTLYAALALWASFATLTQATDDTQGKVIALELQNDAIAGTDRYYSSGFELAVTGWQRLVSPTPFVADLEQLPPPPSPGSLASTSGDTFAFRSFALGQKIYTPADLSRAEYIPNDRPYAGWAYVRIDYESNAAHKRKRFAIEAGTFGSNALADDLQRSVHKLIDSAAPQGWQHQIENELAADLILEQESRLLSRRATGDYRLRLSKTERLTFGTANTRFDLGIKAYLDNGYSFDKRRSLRYFTRFSLAWIGRDRSLSGALRESLDRVQKISLVPEFELGFEYRMRKTRLYLSLTQLGHQFKGQSKAHAFGTLRISLW